VEVTIDLDLQRAAEESMAELIAQLRASGEDGADMEGGAVVVMDTKTGQVLACASYPTYDPSKYFEEYNSLLEQDYNPLFNRALQAQYPPGSTYKMSMVVAGINSGTIGYGTYLEDKGAFTKYSPFVVNCLRWTQSHRTHGYVNAVTALQDSCNYFFYDIADRMNIQAIDSTAKGLGLGEATGVELAEKLGYRANAENKKLLYANSTEAGATNWYPADQLMASIGQSINQFTPMQLCVYTNTLANRGVRYKATFLNRVMSADYRDLVYENEPVILSTMEISDSAYRAYTEGMRAVVTNGTAKSIFANYPVAVAAKTGTAQHSGSKDASDNGAFVCYAPYDDPEISIAVYGEKAGHGSTMGQIAKAILDAYYSNAGSGITGENQVS
jgi:penicillin-binding protein 2